jgi:chemotaxis protein methyltransferase WspC
MAMTTVPEFASMLSQTMGLSADSVGLSFIEAALKTRLSACKLKDLHDYWEHVHACETELQELIDAVIVPETWFFRDRESFAALAHEAYDKWLPAHPDRQLSLLSLPCATGEEPYSMAMALLAAGFPGNRFRIDAIDISERVLKRAQQAVYGRNSFRGKNLEFRDRFFEPAGSEFSLAQKVRAQVRFQQGNLLAPGFMPDTPSYDFIFCRNVLIYFDRATQDRAVHVLRRLLKADGFLFVGPSESGLLLNHDFVSAKLPLAFAFRNKAHAALGLDTGLPTGLAPPPKPSRAPVKRVARPAAADKPGAAARPVAPLVQPAATPTGLDEIFGLANQGQMREAIQRCEEFLRTRGPSAQAYHLMGLAHDATSRYQEAESYYRKALYLDPGHQEVLVHLAFLLEKRGDAAGAERLHRRAKRESTGKARLL